MCRVAPSPLLLTWHFFAVAFYSIWVLFAHQRVKCVTNAGEKGDKKEKVLVGPPPITEYPALCVLSVKAVGFLATTFFSSDLPFLVLDRMRRVRAFGLERDSLVVKRAAND
jgi:hypothetical protein